MEREVVVLVLFGIGALLNDDLVDGRGDPLQECHLLAMRPVSMCELVLTVGWYPNLNLIVPRLLVDEIEHLIILSLASLQCLELYLIHCGWTYA